MDRLFSFNGNSSEISQDFFPPIQLDSNCTYALGLYSLNTYNSIPNVVKDVNDTFCYKDDSKKDNVNSKKDNADLKYITIPEGAYELEEIEAFILNKLKTKHGNSVEFSLKPNLNTLKVELYCSFTVLSDFPQTIMQMLGFNKSDIPKNTLKSSDFPVQITTINEFNVECNIVEGSFRNGRPCHTIFAFYPDVPNGYKLSLLPTNVIYLPINTRTISNITLRLTDQQGKLLNFRGEEISIQLNLKKIWG